MGLLYKYYMAHRPPAPGAIPNGAVECTGYNTRTYVQSIDRMAWGEAKYDHPLTDKEVTDYELIPDKRSNGKKEPWIVFYGPDGTELASYTVRGTFDGELQNTIELLAYENRMQQSEISFAEVTR